MMLPRISRPAVLAAICQFDTELRVTEAWVAWEANRAHRWAIEHDARALHVALRVGAQEFQIMHGRRAGKRDAYAPVVAQLHSEQQYVAADIRADERAEGEVDGVQVGEDVAEPDSGAGAPVEDQLGVRHLEDERGALGPQRCQALSEARHLRTEFRESSSAAGDQLGQFVRGCGVHVGVL
jgi:hypothetical protein